MTNPSRGSEDPVIIPSSICFNGDTLCVEGTSSISIPAMVAVFGKAFPASAGDTANPWSDGREPARGEVLTGNAWRVCGIEPPSSETDVDLRIWAIYRTQDSFSATFANIDTSTVPTCGSGSGSTTLAAPLISSLMELAPRTLLLTDGDLQIELHYQEGGDHNVAQWRSASADWSLFVSGAAGQLIATLVSQESDGSQLAWAAGGVDVTKPLTFLRDPSPLIVRPS